MRNPASLNYTSLIIPQVDEMSACGMFFCVPVRQNATVLCGAQR